uniref:Uncharacterized protein n=1 Tax=Opuntia streptacantha TaxID=393608 RepID=A0A7C8ZBJ0_OPUST
MCYPLHPGFTWPPPSTTTPFISLTQIQPANGEKQVNNFQNPGSQVQQADQESYNCSIQQPIPHQHHHQLQATRLAYCSCGDQELRDNTLTQTQAERCDRCSNFEGEGESSKLRGPTPVFAADLRPERTA